MFPGHMLIKCNGLILKVIRYSENPRFCYGLIGMLVPKSVRIATIFDVILHTINISVIPPPRIGQLHIVGSFGEAFVPQTTHKKHVDLTVAPHCVLGLYYLLIN